MLDEIESEFSEEWQKAVTDYANENEINLMPCFYQEKVKDVASEQIDDMIGDLLEEFSGVK